MMFDDTTAVIVGGTTSASRAIRGHGLDAFGGSSIVDAAYIAGGELRCSVTKQTSRQHCSRTEQGGFDQRLLCRTISMYWCYGIVLAGPKKTTGGKT
jgi:hypothetical protein